MRSIGESAALGAAGTVMWGASADYNDKVILYNSGLKYQTLKIRLVNVKSEFKSKIDFHVLYGTDNT